METQINFQKGNTFLIIAIIVGVVAIGAVGFVSWKYFGGGSELEKEIQPVYSPKQEKTVPQVKEQEEIIPSGKVDERADWKSYKNTKGNYQIEIPKDWKVEENMKEEKTSAGVGSSEIVSTSFTSPDFQKHWANNGALIYDSGAILNVSVSAGKPVGSPDYCVKPDLKKIKAERYNKTDAELWKIDVAEFSCNWKTYYIFMICKTKNPISYEQIFNQVLSSFKFIETDGTADWKTYRNEKYGFEVSYPKDWEIEIPQDPHFPSYHGINYQSGSEPFLVSWLKKGIEPEKDIDFLIHTTKKPDNLFNKSFEDMCSEWLECGSSVSKVIIDGDKEAIRCIRPTGPATVHLIWLKRNNIDWVFMSSGIYDLEEPEKQILSTFKFTD